MVDALDGRGAAQEEERAKLTETARQVSASVLSATTVAAAQAALRAVAKNDGRGAIGEPAADLRRLRRDPALAVALRRDLDVAQGQARMLIGDALWMGYRRGAADRAAQLTGPGLQVVVDLTAEDRADLVDYPVLGLTTGETAIGIRADLEQSVNRALAMPLTGSIDPEALPAALAETRNDHAQRVATAVGEAYQAGLQAALRAVTAALVGG